MSHKEGAIIRASVPEIDNILGRTFPVLDDGFIRVIDYMGSDAAIVQAARVSYGSGTKQVRRDRDLIRYLMRHNHTSPFEMCEIKFHIRVPMDCWRQWIRHRTANVNEYSTRYSEAIDSAQKTPPDKWRTQGTVNRQGSAGLLDRKTGSHLSRQEADLQEQSHRIYRERLEKGVAREQARKDLPLSTYTEAYWKIDLNNLLHFLQLRMDWHAQEEIRSYARIIGEEIVSVWCPFTWEAFQDYRKGAVYLSRDEQHILEAISLGENERAIQRALEAGLIRESGGIYRSSLEGKELEEKLRRMNIRIPWRES
jgi:thymidylate synthase (FAD)